MKNKLLKYLNIDIILSSIAFAAICIVLWQVDDKNTSLIICISVSFFTIVILLLRKVFLSNNIVNKLKGIVHSLEVAESGSDSMFPMPIVIISKNGNIAWYNDLFYTNVLNGIDMIDVSFQDIVGSLDYKSMEVDKGACECSYLDKHYLVYAAGNNSRSEKMRAFYFINVTELKNTANEYCLSRPVIAHITYDSYNELMKSVKDSERAIIAGKMEMIIHNGLKKYGGALLKTAPDHYVLVFERRYLQEIKDSKFSLLDKTREVSSVDNSLSTISIGVGYSDEGFAASDEMAIEALDMALGRGGDQAAIRNSDGFEFYGGKSRGVEKLTKVKTRVIATEIQNAIISSDVCLIMGHKNSDYDCIGSAIGMYRACISCGKPAYIVVDRYTSLGSDMISNYSELSEYKNVFISPDRALDILTNNTLMLIVDVHLPELLESSQLYNECEKVIVIDHHRKGVNFIDRALVFCHEPFASSTSEIITELVQYMNNVALIKSDAEALLTGIMLDTKKFSVRTGVRTFDAAAYLKKCGADSSEAQKYFSKNMKEYQFVSSIITNSVNHNGCAISICKGKKNADYKILATQAIDELLNISDFSASFLIYEENYGVSISARSNGAINVQLVMEKLGGGGHYTMAGTQIEGISVEQAYESLCNAIDETKDINK